MAPRRSTSADHEAAAPRGRRKAKLTLVAIGAGLAAGTLIAVAAVNADLSAGADGCEQTQRPQPLRVVVVPELSDLLSAAVQVGGIDTSSCLAVTVATGDAASVAQALRTEVGERPDVRIPDSSLWLARSGSSVPTDPPRSFASSPLTLAVPRPLASSIRTPVQSLTITDLLPKAPDSAGPRPSEFSTCCAATSVNGS